MLALSGSQLLEGFGLLQDVLTLVLGQRSEDGKYKLARRRSGVDAQVQGIEVVPRW